ncbi:MAG TPA: FmdE family protein [Methanocorpusculum sp.]|nr:FmdE family protein [Methanocorpusculum sp.]
MKDFADVVAFHGHSCGGLALGYKACELAAEKLGLHFSEDEEIVAVTETDSCTVDAIQVLLGCTAGKGNLFVNNWGKTAFSFYRRDNNTSIRLVAVPDAVPKNARMVELRPKIMDGSATPAEDEEYHRLLHEHVHEILVTPAEKLFIIKDAVQPLPKEAKIYNNVVCSVCGEQVADGLAKQIEGKYICIPCQMRK